MVYGKCQAGQRHECIARQNNSPRITRDDIHIVAAAQIELLGGILKAVEKTRAGCAGGDFGFIHFLQAAGRYLADTGGKYDRLALADRQLEITRHP